MLTRRHFIITTTTLFSGALAMPALAQDAVGLDLDDTIEQATADGPNPWGLHPRFMPQRVAHNAGLTPGDIHVDPTARYLYHIGNDGTAMRYGVAVGRAGLYQPGRFRIQRVAEWPSWTPTANMIAREPHIYAQYAGGVPGGPDNPLGARALYLYAGGRDTYLRIHGTPQPWSIGTSASSGCVRLVNDHVIQLAENVTTGSRAILHS
ncbi:L,D-transpeptidase [Hasllibacter sp. MH4015]|uniref:L,D-transpeptidase n=1 Tax=Hasllibacter sp. MH4015 TaxID=2854029 RepID=UPI001CD41C25|nr:L,D-transpeptidase [Hasllibacter sp. MH4015]